MLYAFRELLFVLHAGTSVIKIDDILTTDKTDEEHWENIEKILVTLEEVGLTVNVGKC